MPLPIPAPIVLAPAAAKLIHAAAYIDFYSMTSATLAAVLARMAWNSTPDWVREDVSVRALVSSDKNSNSQKEELTHIASIIEKLQLLVEVGSSKCGGPIKNLNAAVLAYIQLAGQLKLKSLTINDNFSLEHSEGQALETTSSEKNAITSRDNLFCSSGAALDQETYDDINNGGKLTLKEALDYATWAYDDDFNELQDKLEANDFFLFKHKYATRPGYVSYYVAINPERQLILVAVRGTSTIEDLMTDCCGRAVPYNICDDEYFISDGNLQNNDHLVQDRSRVEVCAKSDVEVSCSNDSQDNFRDSNVEIIRGDEETIFIEDDDYDDADVHTRCHEGIKISATRLANDLQPIVQDFIIGGNTSVMVPPLNRTKAGCEHENDSTKGYHLVLCGHSLGAGVCSLVGVILRSRIPQLISLSETTATDSTSTNNFSKGINSHSDNKMTVYAFAPPPILDADTSIGCIPYTISVVHNADIIPRSSLVNLSIFLELMRHVVDKLDSLDMRPQGPKSTIKFINKLLKGVKDDNLLMSVDEINSTLNKIHDNIEHRNPHHLYIPGRVVLTYVPWDGNNSIGENEYLTAEDEGEVEMVEMPCDEKNNVSEESKQPNHLHCTVTDGTAPVLRFFEIDGHRMITDHLTASYYSSIEALESKFGRISPT